MDSRQCALRSMATVLKRRRATTTITSKKSSRCTRGTRGMREWSWRVCVWTARRSNVPYDVIFYKWNRIGNKSWHSVEEFLPKLLFYAVLVWDYQFSSYFLSFLAFLCFLFGLLLFTLIFLCIFDNRLLFLLYLTHFGLYGELLYFLLNLLNFILNFLLFLLLFNLSFRLLLFLLFLDNVIQQCSSPVNLLNIIIVDVILAE